MKATECSHTDADEYCRGICRPCYTKAQRAGEFKDFRFASELIDWCSFNVDATWDDAMTQFGDRTREQLRSVLNYHRQHKLISRLDSRSNTHYRGPYIQRVIAMLEFDRAVTWGVLNRMFDGRSKATLSAALYREKRKDLVRQVNQASRKGLRNAEV